MHFKLLPVVASNACSLSFVLVLLYRLEVVRGCRIIVSLLCSSLQLSLHYILLKLIPLRFVLVLVHVGVLTCLCGVARAAAQHVDCLSLEDRRWSPHVHDFSQSAQGFPFC
jgi:hypothetical protein